MGCQSPALGAIRSDLGDQGSGDVVAVASAFLDRVRWGEPLPPSIDQYARQQAQLGSTGLATMVARIGRELIASNVPGLGLGVDQRRMLPGVELALVGNLTAVDRVRQQGVDVPARERLAAALDAASGCAAPGPEEPQAVGLLLDPAHAAELTIKRSGARSRPW